MFPSEVGEKVMVSVYCETYGRKNQKGAVRRRVSDLDGKKRQRVWCCRKCQQHSLT